MSNRTKGILLLILSAFFFACMNMFVKLSGDELPVFQKVFFRNAMASVIAFIVLLKNKAPLRPTVKGSWKYLVLRTLFGLTGVVCNYYALETLVLSDASILNKMSPFFAVIFSFIFIHERLFHSRSGRIFGRRMRGSGLRLCAQARIDGGEQSVYRVLLLDGVHPDRHAYYDRELCADDGVTVGVSAQCRCIRGARAVLHHRGVYLRARQGDLRRRFQPDHLRVADEPDRIPAGAGYLERRRLCHHHFDGDPQLFSQQGKSH